MIQKYDAKLFTNLVKAGGIINSTLQELPEDIAVLYEPQFKQLLGLVEYMSHLGVLHASEPEVKKWGD